jgi:hypothetical protein
MSQFPRLFRRVERRLRLSRPGSVLILCVALLVLLALIGTAMISTSRLDRYTAVQHTTNTQVDLLVEGVKKMAEGAIVGDLFDNGTTPAGYRAPLLNPVSTASPTYDNWDMPTVTAAPLTTPPQNDLFLASRYPDRLNLFSPYAAGPNNTPTSASNPILWRAISAPLTTLQGTSNSVFEDPSTKLFYTARTEMCPGSISVGGTIYPALTQVDTGTTCLAADADGDGIADSGLFPLPVGTINGVTYFAAVRIVDNNSAINANTALSRNYEFSSTYTTTNTSVASADIFDPLGTGAGGVHGYYRTNVGLMELLQSYNTSGYTNLSPEMRALNEYRWGNTTQASLNPGTPDLVVVGNSSQTFNSYTFTYLNQCDAMENGLSRRLDNPDKNPLSGGGSTLFAKLPDSDSAALASKFCLANPEASPSTTEALLPNSLGGGAVATSFTFDGSTHFSIATTPYAPSASQTWYSQNFYWDAPNTTTATSTTTRLPLRSMLVTRNPVTNLIPAITIPDTSASPAIPSPLVPIAGATGMPTTSGGTVNLPGMASYHYLFSNTGSGTVNVVLNAKTDINTAPFEDLWRAYWSVLGDGATGSTPNPVFPPFPTTDDPGTVSGDPRTQEGRMFRSSWRLTGAPAAATYVTSGTPGTPPPPPYQYLPPGVMLQLRSALAAINAIGLRDSDDNVISRNIPLYDVAAKGSWSAAVSSTPAFTARVYGTEKQPFITEVYIDTYAGPVGAPTSAHPDPRNNPAGYIAVELHNPYSAPLVLNNWAIGIIDRSYPTATPTLISVGSLTAGALPPGTNGVTGSTVLPTTGYGNNPRFLGAGQVIIPGNSYVVLENYPPGGVALNSATDAQYRPNPANFAGADQKTIYVPYLSDAINPGRELVLLRPHLSGNSGLPPATTGIVLTEAVPSYLSKCTTDSSNIYNEGTIATPNLADFVPIDSFNCTGVIPPNATPDPTTLVYTGNVYHYARDDQGAGASWKFVYPGLMIPSATPLCHFNVLPWAQNGTDYTTASATEAPNVSLGSPAGAPPSAGDQDGEACPFPGIQLAADDWPTHLSVDGAGFPQTPLGAFARNGDILQVPFIGAYQIRDGTQAVDDPKFEEMNSVTMDCAFCDAQSRVPSTGLRDTTDTTDQNAQPVECVGRFCPIQNTPINDYDLTGTYSTSGATQWRYHFGEKLFDYLTVQSPDSDYKPNADPKAYLGNMSPVQNSLIVPTANPNNPLGSTLNQTTNGEEVTTGVEGLININTAPWWVLASLPLLPPDIAVNNGAGATAYDNSNVTAIHNNNGFPKNIENLAKQIVTWRDGDGTVPNPPHGPFRSIFDLNRVTDSTGHYIFRDAIKLVRNLGGTGYDFSNSEASLIPPLTPTYDSKPIDGDFSPATGAVSDGVTNDFEENYLMLNRISNLITTRSDTFTVYIVVQGWRGVGTNPQLVAQRRAAFIIDRSNVTGVSGAQDPKKTTVSTD